MQLRQPSLLRQILLRKGKERGAGVNGIDRTPIWSITQATVPVRWLMELVLDEVTVVKIFWPWPRQSGEQDNSSAQKTLLTDSVSQACFLLPQTQAYMEGFDTPPVRTWRYFPLDGNVPENKPPNIRCWCIDMCVANSSRCQYSDPEITIQVFVTFNDENTEKIHRHTIYLLKLI